MSIIVGSPIFFYLPAFSLVNMPLSSPLRFLHSPPQKHAGCWVNPSGYPPLPVWSGHVQAPDPVNISEPLVYIR